MNRKLATIATALTALAATLLSTAPTAAASSTPVVATYKVTPGYYDLAAGLNAVWALNNDEYHNGQLYRIDPKSHGMKLVTTLSFPAGGIEVAYGSIWVSDYFGNAVWRLGASGQVQAEIGVGLQPQWVHAGLGSLWSSNHHGASLTRIDPATNTVQATVQVGAPDTFRNGPQVMTDDGTNLYAVSSNLQSLQSVNASNTVTTGPAIDDAFCGGLAALASYVWSTDNCTGATYQLNPDGSVNQVIPSTGVPQDVTARAGHVWIADDTTGDTRSGQGTDAVLAERDPVTGGLLRTVAIGGDATRVIAGFGDLWVWDSHASTIRRVHV